MPLFPPGGTKAPGFFGPTPPDRVEMSFEDHLAAALKYLTAGIQSGTMSGEDLMALRAFEEAKQQLLGGVGQPEAAEEEVPGGAELNGETSDYGTGGAGTQPITPFSG